MLDHRYQTSFLGRIVTRDNNGGHQWETTTTPLEYSEALESIVNGLEATAIPDPRATEKPKPNPVLTLGVVSVLMRDVVAKSKTYAKPLSRDEVVPLERSYVAPTTKALGSAATDHPKLPPVSAFGL